MLIKDIRTFREFYKTNIIEADLKNRNPHFAGDIKQDIEREFGFFHMFNGYGDIENKLTTILNIAGDTQAIYEFMQNAVDANSKNFFLSKYEHDSKPYLIVLNDGDYFTLESIISILAIGASSKYRNPDNIGQFGVGFKLAHRLIGADNSLKELLEENKGPLLFSWSDSELSQLVNAEAFDIINPQLEGYGREAFSNNNEPWLFKIIATNFPCQMNDVVWDAKGKASTSLFTTEDVEALRGAAKQCLEKCTQASTFTTGTLLVIPLHPAKVEHVVGKVPKGLEVAATIISRRARKEHDLKTMIETEELIPEKLLSEHWELPVGETHNNLGNEQVKQAELMFLYANPFKANPFKGKPQFYRYFPMSVELHGFRFAIHGNALTPSAARTELFENDSNIFLLGKLVERLESRLKEYAERDAEKFLQLYATIILSNRGEGSNSEWMQGRQWLEKPLWQPLLRMLKNTVPVKCNNDFALAEQPQNVLIKNSTLPIESWYIKPRGGWFYWDEKSQPLICYEAKQKLLFKSINLLDVLSDVESIGQINRWLSQSSQHAEALLKELNELSFEGYDKTLVWKNFSLLNLWWFDAQVYSAERLANDDTLKYQLINYGPLHEIKERLAKVGIGISLHHIDVYENIERSIRETLRVLPYLFNYEELNKHLSNAFSSAIELSPDDKKAIFTAIEKAVRGSANLASRRIETMKPLALFANKRGEIKPLHQLTSNTALPRMLQSWRISEGETSELNLKEYLSVQDEAIYEHIVKPFWNDIADQPQQTPHERTALFDFIKKCYTLKPAVGGLMPDTIFFAEKGERFNDNKKNLAAFYHQTLSELNFEEYELIAGLFYEAGIYFPQQTLLTYYGREPFVLSPAYTIDLKRLQHSTSVAQATALIKWLLSAFPALVKEYIFSVTTEGAILIEAKLQHTNQYVSKDADVHAYVQSYVGTSLKPLPNQLHSLLGNSFIHSNELLKRLIHETKEYERIPKELFQLVQKNGNEETKEKLLATLKPFELSSQVEPDSLSYLALKLCFKLDDANTQKNTLGNLLLITVDDKLQLLNQVQNRGSDAVVVQNPKKGALPFSVNNLLGDGNEVNYLLTAALKHWETIGVGTNEQISMALGIHEQRQPNDVLKQMFTELDDGKIENGEQLFFLWAMSGTGNLANHKLQVETLNGWALLNNSYYSQPLTFISKAKTLSSKYVLPELAFTNNKKLDEPQWTLQAAPYLDGNKLNMPSVEAIDEREHSAFWKFLFELWQANGSPAKIALEDETQSWQSLLGIVPADFIVANEYRLDEETPPFEMLVGCGIAQTNANANEFMAALGAQNEGAAIVETRKYFAGKGGAPNYELTQKQIVSTLKWLCNNGIAIQQPDLIPFYRKLAQSTLVELNYFPAFIPESEALKIVLLSPNVFHVTKQQLEEAQSKGLKPHDILRATNAPVINLASLQDWANYISAHATPLAINTEPDWEEAQLQSQEWEFPFYKEWKERYPNQKICLLNNEVPHKIVVNGNIAHRFPNHKAVYHLQENTAFIGGADTEHLLAAIDNLKAIPQLAREHLRKCYVEHEGHLQQYIELAKNDSGFAQLLKERGEQLQLKIQREINADVVKNTNSKNTLSWFISLLELVRVQEKSANIPEVVFTKCERLPSAEKVYELSENTGKIPQNIDRFEDLPAVITYIDDEGHSVEIKTKLVASDKHQKLWVMFPEVTIQPIVETKKIVEVRLEFTKSVELIEELKRGFKRLNLLDTQNLKNTLSANIDFIFGPPGTGKTTFLARGIIDKLNAGAGSIVVLTPTNKAADVLTKKIIEQNNNIAPAWLIRAGTCTDPFLLHEQVVKHGEDLLLQPSDSKVLITTIHRFPYFMIPVSAHNNDKARLCDYSWSEVIFDEASMIPLAYIVHAIHAQQSKKPSPHFLIAGDPLQIPPVFELLSEDLEDVAEELQQENIYTMIGLHSFDETKQSAIPIYGNRIHNLNTQHRSIPALGALFSKFQYHEKIKHSRGTAANNKPGTSRQLPPRFEALGIKPVTIIRYPVKSEGSIFKPQKLEGSPLHLYCSLLVSELIKLFKNEVERDEEPWTIGVLAPYRSQADALLKMIEAHTQNSQQVTITTDTVHGFQGDENNIVFAVLNPSGNGGNISCSRFLKKEFILNVAISRAEDYLILFIPDDRSKGIYGLPLLTRLIEIAQETAPNLLSVMNASDIEHELMGEYNYFEKFSFPTAHQKVNVYGKPAMPYMIRMNEKSLDVHWEV